MSIESCLKGVDYNTLNSHTTFRVLGRKELKRGNGNGNQKSLSSIFLGQLEYPGGIRTMVLKNVGG